MPAGMRQIAPTMPQKTKAMLTTYLPALWPSVAMFWRVLSPWKVWAEAVTAPPPKRSAEARMTRVMM